MIDIEIENLMVFDAPKTFSEDDDDSSGNEKEPSENEEPNEENKKKRRRKTVLWSFVKQFDNEELIDSEIRPKWTQKKTHNTLAGNKVYFYCNYPKCPARIHLLYIRNQTKISLFSDQNEHLHLPINKVRRIDDKLKEPIKNLYNLGVTGALNIIYALRDKKVENIPSQRQIYNFLYEYKQELYGTASMTFNELKNWCENNTYKNFLNDDGAYVLDYYVSIKDKYFRLVMTTNRLINLINKLKIVVIDATYKVIFQGYALIVAGTVDFERHFHTVCVGICTRETEDDYEFVFKSIKKKCPNFCPEFLLADGAHSITNGFEKFFGNNYKRIMCWAHAERAMEKHLKIDKDSKKKLLQDIYSLQLCYSDLKFKLGYELLKEKWLINEAVKGIEEYFDYFEKEWIKSSNFGWFEGLALSYPSTNNALEATNKSIKDVHNFRERVPFSQFIERLKIILNRISTDRLSLKKFKEEPDVSGFWQQAIDYSNEKPKIKFDQFENAYLLSLDHEIDFENYIDSLECDENCYLEDCEFVSCINFDSYVEFNNSVRVVRLNENNWKFSICTCKDYLKKYMCKHIIVIAVKKKLATIPEKYFDSVIGSKPKPGKKKKAQAWYIIQNN